MCGALPCDWTEDPHHHQSLAFSTLAKIREVTGVGVKPMLTELPDAIASELQRLQAENDDQAHKLLIAGWRKDGDGSVWTPPENAEITALVEATREAQQAYVQADNESLRLRGEVERLRSERAMIARASAAHGWNAGFFSAIGKRRWDGMHDFAALSAQDYGKSVALNLQGE